MEVCQSVGAAGAVAGKPDIRRKFALACAIEEDGREGFVPRCRV